MKIKTAELTGTALDWAVAKRELVDEFDFENQYARGGYRYSTDWAQGGPILTREHISRTIDHSGLWIAYWTEGYEDSDTGKKWMQCDRSELVAGLRCYVAAIGDVIEVPEELT